MTPKASKPCEVISFFSIDLSHKDNETLIFYMTLDSFSDYLFNLGSSDSNINLNLLNAIDRLMQEEKFKLYNHPFTLVTHQYEDILSTIESIINPHQGLLIANDIYVNKQKRRIEKSILSHFSKRF